MDYKKNDKSGLMKSDKILNIDFDIQDDIWEESDEDESVEDEDEDDEFEYDEIVAQEVLKKFHLSDGNLFAKMISVQLLDSFEDTFDSRKNRFARLVAFGFFVLGLVAIITAILWLAVIIPLSFVRYVRKVPDWNLSMKNCLLKFFYGMVMSLVMFGTIFSVRFGRAILKFSFNFVDPTEVFIKQLNTTP